MIKVRATRDFLVGPDHEVVVRKGAVRDVETALDGSFATTTDKGHFFGGCNLYRGWERIDLPPDPKPVMKTDKVCPHCDADAVWLEVSNAAVIWCAAGHVLTVNDGTRTLVYNFHDGFEDIGGIAGHIGR